MATEYYYFSGIAKWAQLKTPNKFGKHSINLYIDSETRKAIRATGARINPKEDDEGFFVTFRRDPNRDFGDGPIGAPKVVDSEGQPFNGLVGNGSKVTVKVVMYNFPAGEKNGEKYAAGKGTRLEAVRIDELVEYTPESNSDSEGSVRNNLEGLPF